MSELGYIVRVNGLFNIPDKPSKKIGKGLMEQIRDGEPHQYEGLDSEGIPTIPTVASLADRIVPYQNLYNGAQTRIGSLIGEERDRQHEVSTPPQVDRRRLVLNTLQRQLQQGEISAMDYLDLISQQE